MRGTTPELTFNLPFDASTIKSLYVTFTDKEKNIVLEKTEADFTLSGSTIKGELSQEETLLFEERTKARVQIRILTTDGKALKSIPFDIHIDELLKDGVIE